MVLSFTRITQVLLQMPMATLSSPIFKSTTLGEWDFDISPSLNSTSHLVFDSVGSLMQHWTNTRYRNGHNIVPGTVPIGTLLYHGTYKQEVPTEPEWTALDPELSYLFCRSDPTNSSASGYWHLTLVATRPLKVLYFDGSSAAKMQSGPLDSQDIVIWGEVRLDRTLDERKRINKLCDWGREFELDGFMRMEMDFEIMLCDFTRGVEIVSFLNIQPDEDKWLHSAPSNPPGPEPELPPGDGASYTLQHRVIEAGMWHNAFPGETRVNLDVTRLVSFYDTDLFPSLTDARFGQERWEHRLQGLVALDSKRFQTRIREVFGQELGSGVDWRTLIHVVVDRYAERLEVLQYLLNTTSTTEHAKKIQRQLRTMLVPYILHTAAPTPDSTNYSWALPVYEHCATTHTRYISSTPSILAKLTKSESLILRSIQEVSKEICRVVVGMWAEGVELGLDIIPPASTSPSSSTSILELGSTAITGIMDQWQKRTQDLMAWLDWSVWAKCNTACGHEEVCYLPTWPFLHGPYWPHDPSSGLDVGQVPMDARLPGIEDREEGRPQPKCIRRVEPFTGI